MWLSLWLFLFVGGNGLVLRARPMDDHRLRQLPRPVEHKWLVATAVRKAKHFIFELHSTTLVFDAGVTLAFPRWLGCWVGLASFPPAFETSKEGLHTGIAGMSMQLQAFEQAHQVLRFEPDTLVEDCPPKEDQRFAIEFATGMGETIELGGLADVYPSHLIHTAFPPLWQ